MIPQNILYKCRLFFSQLDHPPHKVFNLCIGRDGDHDACPRGVVIGCPPPFPPCMYRAWLLGVRDARVEVPVLPHHCLDASHQGLRLPYAGSTSHGGDNGTLIQTLVDSQGLGGVQVMVRHKVAHDLLVLGREAGIPTRFLPSGIEQCVPCLPGLYLCAQRPERSFIRQGRAAILVLHHNGRFV